MLVVPQSGNFVPHFPGIKDFSCTKFLHSKFRTYQISPPLVRLLLLCISAPQDESKRAARQLHQMLHLQHEEAAARQKPRSTHKKSRALNPETLGDLLEGATPTNILHSLLHEKYQFDKEKVPPSLSGVFDILGGSAISVGIYQEFARICCCTSAYPPGRNTAPLHQCRSSIGLAYHITACTGMHARVCVYIRQCHFALSSQAHTQK